MTDQSDSSNKTKEQLIAELEQLRAELDDHKRREAALWQSKQLIEKVTNDLPHHLYIYDLETLAPLYANRPLLGYSPEEIVQGGGRFFLDILHPDDQRRLADFGSRWDTTADSEVLEFDAFRFRHANGSWHWMQTWQVVFARNEHGKPIQALGTTIDITERKLAEDAQRRSEAKFTKVFHANPDPIAITTFPDGRFVEANESFYQITGWSPDAVIGKTSSELKLWVNVEARAQLYQSLAETGSVNNLEFVFRTQAGEVKTGLMSIDVIDLEGQSCALSVIKDITDRKRIEEDLRRSNALLQAQCEASVAGLWVVNERREVLFYNQRFCEIWQIPQSIIDTNDYWKIFKAALSQVKDVDAFLTKVEGLYQNLDAVSHDEVVLHNGRVLDRRSAPMRSSTGEYYGRVWYFQDVTQAKQVEAARYRAQEALRQSQERYVLATRAARVGVWEGNYKTGEFYLDPNFKFLLGYSDVEIPNHFDAWLSVFHSDDKSIVADAARRYLEKQTPEFAVEHRIFHRDGSIRWLMARGQLVQDGQDDSSRMVGTTTDITERKLAEQALQRSNAMLKVQQEAAIDGILITNEYGQIVSYNQRFCLLWHLDEALLLKVEDLCQVREAVLDQLKDPEAFLRQTDYLSENSDATCRKEFLFKDGRVFDAYSAGMKSSSGENYGRIWYYRDITEIKQAEIALRQNEQKFLQLTENIRDAFFIAAPDYSQMFYISPAYETIWGRSCASLYHQPHSWLEAVHPDDRSGLSLTLKSLGNPIEERLEYRIIQPNGDVRWVLTRTFPIFDEAGHVHRVAGIAQDITELKQIEAELKQYQDQLEALVVERTKELNEANQQLQQELRQREQTEATLRESERRWRTLMEDVRLLVVGFDTQLNITYANPFLAEVTGYSQTELVGRNWLDVFDPSSQLPQLLIEPDFFIKAFRVHHQDPLLTKAGEVRQIAWNCTLLHNAQGNPIGFLSIGEDITERSLIERMKDEFISVVSHEFRTPLTAIHGALDLLIDGLVERNSDRAQQLLTIAFEGSDRLVHLVDSILALERLESGDVKLLKQPCQIADLMMKAIDLTQLMAASAGVDLVVAPLTIQLEIDGDRILQVLTNLLSNAIKFSSSGDTVWLSAELQDGDRWVNRNVKDDATASFARVPTPPPFRSCILFSVKDQGRGIPSDKLETIFERFQQVDTSDSRQKGGTGLGLAICRSIVQQHNGRIWAESTLGEGSSFYVMLPVDEQD
ncbi:MAG: PAS domain S-box protein [Stenomitos rutilans HA7619-LM2]|jgi:PAS domain S-box-containing protein|nr:PAS domain S-box protein [Stenomitos rutilans HA7619-LM2]